MPLYEFYCRFDGVFELLLPMSEWERDQADCPGCGRVGTRLASRVTMKPDALWAGHYLEGYGYTTSASKLAQIRKEKHWVEVGDRADKEAMKKTAAEAAKARDEKFAKDTRKFAEEAFSGKGILDSFGNLRPEAARKLSDEEILDPERQKQKKETIVISHSND